MALMHGMKPFDSPGTLGQTGSAMTSATRDSSFGILPLAGTPFGALAAEPSGPFMFVVVMSILPV
jgi:hypothetical protein